MKSAKNPLQSVATLRFFTLAPIGPLINVGHHLFVLRPDLLPITD
jgi:hypothetical protein